MSDESPSTFDLLTEALAEVRRVHGFIQAIDGARGMPEPSPMDLTLAQVIANLAEIAKRLGLEDNPPEPPIILRQPAIIRRGETP